MSQLTSTQFRAEADYIPRRTVIKGLAGLALVMSGFGCAPSPDPPSAPAPTVTPRPLGSTIYIYHGHSDQVIAVAWSPDGKRIASGSSDKTVQVWDATTGNHAYTYHGHSNGVTAVAWSPDGRRIASGSFDKTVQVWNATTGDMLYTYRGYNVEAAKLNPAKGGCQQSMHSGWATARQHAGRVECGPMVPQP